MFLTALTSLWRRERIRKNQLNTFIAALYEENKVKKLIAWLALITL